jgi:hypothetical protein
MHERPLEEAQTLQRSENDAMLRSAQGPGVRMHHMRHDPDPRLQLEAQRPDVKGEPPMSIGMRAFPIRFLKMALQDKQETIDADGFSESQEDSGAGMHLHNDLDDYVLGYTTEFTIFAGSADKGKDMVKLGAVGPLIRVFYGTDVNGKRVRTIRNIGPAGAIPEGNWASLTSHNGIVRERVDKDGTERNLDNTFDAQRQLLVFDVSDNERRVEVKMTRRNGGSYLESRRPTEEELAAYLEVNPSMRTWTFAKIMTGSITCNKVSLRGQLHDARRTRTCEQLGA